MLSDTQSIIKQHHNTVAHTKGLPTIARCVASGGAVAASCHLSANASDATREVVKRLWVRTDGLEDAL